MEAVEHCVLVAHAASGDVGCLLTLRTAPGAKLALHRAGLRVC